MRLLALLALAGLGQAAPAPPPPTQTTPAARAAAAFPALTVAPANADGSLRWAIWAEGKDQMQSVQLALIDPAAPGAAPRWTTGWADAYTPTLRTIDGWSYGGRPIVAVDLQFGAAAEQLTLYALDASGRPRKLGERLAAAFGWRIDADGRLLLVAYDARGGLVPSCLAWRDAASTLTPVRCPAR